MPRSRGDADRVRGGDELAPAAAPGDPFAAKLHRLTVDDMRPKGNLKKLIAETRPQRREIERLVHTASTDGERDDHAGRREVVRFAVGMRLDVTTNPGDEAVIQPVTMHNISEHGFAFWIKERIDRRQNIWVREFSPDNSKGWVAAQVTHCTKGIRGFLIGAEFVGAAARRN